MKDIKKMSMAELQAELLRIDKRLVELRAKMKKCKEQMAAESLKEWKKDFDALPIEARKKLTELGASPYQSKENLVIRRETGKMRTV